MIQQSDIPGRLRLLRYGLIVLVVVSALVAVLVPFVSLRGYANAAGQSVQITDFLGWAALATIGVAALAVITYFGYKMILERRSKQTNAVAVNP